MRPHPFFWAVLVPLGLGGWAAVRTPARAPDIALHSTEVYRAEVGLAVFAATYVVVLVLAFAWTGRAVRLQLPGPAVVEPAEHLGNASQESTSVEQPLHRNAPGTPATNQATLRVAAASQGAATPPGALSRK
jgi:hypothetical protein